MSNQIFSKIDGAITTLIGYIENGDLALPDLQRPFVWGNNKVRDLFDSMYRGYPIGYFLLWKNSTGEKLTQIGTEDKIHKTPNMLIIDGQQRLTALYSIIKKQEIRDKDYKLRRIKIAFNPVLEEFRVADAATVKNKEFINDISDVFGSSAWQFTNDYLKQYQDYIAEIIEKYKEIAEKINSGTDLKDAEYIFCITRLNQIKDPTENTTQMIASLRERKAISLPDEQKLLFIDFFEKPIEINTDEIGTRISRLHALTNYPYQALEVSADVDEEIVAEIFTRINSKGVSLNQADFILTLVSVFWEEGRTLINDFCKSAKVVPDSTTKDSPFNYIMQPDAQDIVRVIVGLGFKRARMKDAYAILKGRDPETNKYSTVLREKQFEVFKVTLSDVINTTNWHSLIKIIQGIGYKSSGLIASDNSVINAYIFFLIGKLHYKIDYKELDKLIAKWFFMSSLTSRYSGSSESIMESDLNKIKSCKDGEEFKLVLNNIIESTLTNDFWNISLPNDLLVTSNTISPVANAFFASLIYNGTKALFSDRKISDLYDPSIKIKKSLLDKHHIFPKEYLKRLQTGYALTDINQIANLTYLEYLDNIKILDTDPKSYYTAIKSKYYSGKETVLENSLKEHAVPNDFYDMEYNAFLIGRRKKIAMLLNEMFNRI